MIENDLQVGHLTSDPCRILSQADLAVLKTSFLDGCELISQCVVLVHSERRGGDAPRVVWAGDGHAVTDSTEPRR